LTDKERNPMVKQASNVRKRLRRFLTADPGRFAGGSAVSDPLGLLAVERERLAVLRSPQHDVGCTICPRELSLIALTPRGAAAPGFVHS
jgi:Ribonuclease G/E